MKSFPFRQSLGVFFVAAVSLLVTGCFEPDADLRAKAMAAVQGKTELTQNRNIQFDASSVYVGKSAATVVIPYSMQRADGSAANGSIMVSFRNMAKRWDVDTVTDTLATN